MTDLTINKINREAKVDSATPFLWFLRGTLNLTETKYGCGIQ